MKKYFIILATFLTMLFACRKGDGCKEQQAMDLAKELELFQKQVSNTNLTTEQINELTKRHDERNKQIMAECN